MKKLIVPMFLVLAASAFAFSSSASAAEGKAMTPQREKMANCAHENKGKKGQEYRQAMSECLHGKSMGMMKNEEHQDKSGEKKAEGRMSSSREQMKTCNAQAKDQKLKGKDRKDFMNECLKGG